MTVSVFNGSGVAAGRPRPTGLMAVSARKPNTDYAGVDPTRLKQRVDYLTAQKKRGMLGSSAGSRGMTVDQELAALTKTLGGAGVAQGPAVAGPTPTSPVGPTESGLDDTVHDAAGTSAASADALMKAMQGVLSSPMDASGIKQVGDYASFGDAGKLVQDQLYGTWSKQNEPVFDRQGASFRQRMADEGIPENSEKYRILQSQMMKDQQDARDRQSAVGLQLGSQRQDQLYQGAVSDHNRELEELMTSRTQPIAEAASLLGLSDSVLGRDAQSSAQSSEFAQRLKELGITGQQATDLQKMSQEFAKMMEGIRTKNQIKINAAAPRGGGGGGGGGGDTTTIGDILELMKETGLLDG